ncbi:MAG: DUF4923 family protein [Lachnoclostridium sp.]|nr:DUF4923 family protein [Lachnoclostridium sp.]
MKRTLSFILAALVLTTFEANAQFNLGNLLKGGSQSSSDTTSTSSGSGLGSLISGVTDALGLTSSKVSVADLAGTWNYKAPAVVFKSDNLLLKAGGAAAASTVEAKLENYYKMAGFSSLVLTIDTDSTFTFKVKAMTLSGTISRDDETGNFHFTFQALKKIKLGSMEAFITVKGNDMDLTFDVSKLLTIIEKAGTITGNATLKGVTTLLEQYDGMTAGWTLTRQ